MKISRRLALIGTGAGLAAIACGDSETEDTSSSGSPSGSGGSGSGQGGTSSSAGGSGQGGSGQGGSTGPGSGGSGGSQAVCGAALVVQGSNYSQDPHEITIPVADIVAGVEQTYTCTEGNGGHTHNVTLTAADFTALQNGETVRKYTCRTPAGQTDHEWAISCADPNVMPLLKGEFGTEDDCPNV